MHLLPGIGERTCDFLARSAGLALISEIVGEQAGFFVFGTKLAGEVGQDDRELRIVGTRPLPVIELACGPGPVSFRRSSRRLSCSTQMMSALAINSMSPEKTKTSLKDLLDLKPAVETMLAVPTGAAVSRLRLAMTASRRASLCSRCGCGLTTIFAVFFLPTSIVRSSILNIAVNNSPDGPARPGGQVIGRRSEDP
jgi:hypothetical protein